MDRRHHRRATPAAARAPSSASGARNRSLQHTAPPTAAAAPPASRVPEVSYNYDTDSADAYNSHRSEAARIVQAIREIHASSSAARGRESDESDDYESDDFDDDYDSDGYLYEDFADDYYDADFAPRSTRTSSNQRSDRRNSMQAAAPKPAPPPPVLCRFFVLGKCKYGSRCTYSHAIPQVSADCEVTEEDSLTAAAALVDCPYFLRGNCKFGQYCRLRHAAPASAAGTAAHSNTQPPLRASASASAATSSSNQPADAGSERDHTCGICFDDVVEVGKHFGLLSCDHCFCLDCLRAWRQSKDLEVEVTRSCPACRLPSNYIVPSLTFCTGDAKAQVVEAYKSHLSVRECKYFTGLLGSCPFGPHCFYAHRNSLGEDIKHIDHPRRSKRRGRSGYRRDSSGLASNESLSSLLSNYGSLFRFLESLGWDEYDDIDFDSGAAWD